MAKSLKDILTGIKASKIRPGRTGEKPGVDYDSKSKPDRDFVRGHDTQEHGDRVGNGPEVYSGSKVKKALDDPKNSRLRPKEGVYEETEKVDEDYHPSIEFHVVHRDTGAVKGRYSTVKRARSGADKADNQHGSYAHGIKYFNKDTKQYVDHKDSYVKEDVDLILEHIARPEKEVLPHHKVLGEHGFNMVGKFTGRYQDGADHVYKKSCKSSVGLVDHKLVTRSPDGTWAHYSNRENGSFKHSGLEGKGHESLKKLMECLSSHPLEEELGTSDVHPVPSLGSTASYPGGFGYQNTDTPATI
jgi:hypothetical protein